VYDLDADLVSNLASFEWCTAHQVDDERVTVEDLPTGRSAGMKESDLYANSDVSEGKDVCWEFTTGQARNEVMEQQKKSLICCLVDDGRGIESSLSETETKRLRIVGEEVGEEGGFKEVFKFFCGFLTKDSRARTEASLGDV
jgi:hypothetical protein